MKNSNPFNSASSKVIPYIAVLNILCAVIVYARAFHECYAVSFSEAFMYEVNMDIEYGTLIFGVSAMVYSR